MDWIHTLDLHSCPPNYSSDPALYSCPAHPCLDPSHIHSFLLIPRWIRVYDPSPSGLSPEGQASYPPRIPAELPFSAPSLNFLGSCSLCLPLQDLPVWLSFLPLAACLPVVAASTVMAECRGYHVKGTPIVGSENLV